MRSYEKGPSEQQERDPAAVLRAAQFWSCSGRENFRELQTYLNLHPSLPVGPSLGCLPQGGANLCRFVPIRSSRTRVWEREFVHVRFGHRRGKFRERFQDVLGVFPEFHPGLPSRTSGDKNNKHKQHLRIVPGTDGGQNC